MLCRFSLFHSVDYFSDESSSSTASGNAGGGESDSDSSYCPTSDNCESETVVKKGLVLGSIVVHPLVLQLIEPLTGTERPSCSTQPESVGPVCSAVWSNPIVIPNQVGFVRLSQIGVFVDSSKTQGCDGNLVPVAVKSTRLGGGLSVWSRSVVCIFDTVYKFIWNSRYQLVVNISLEHFPRSLPVRTLQNWRPLQSRIMPLSL